MIGLVVALSCFVGCGGRQVEFTIGSDEVATLRDEVVQMRATLSASLDQSDAFVEEISELPPGIELEFDTLARVRFVLEGCFIDSLEEVSPGAAGYSMMMASERDITARTAVVEVQAGRGPRPLTDRAFVGDYLPCYLDEMRPLEREMQTWSQERRRWLSRVVAVVDALRVSLKALIPELSAQSRLDLSRIEGELQQLMTEAEDTLDRSRRDDVKPETRRRVESRFEEIDRELRGLQEEVDATREQLEELMRRERSYVRRVAVSLARLGVESF